MILSLLVVIPPVAKPVVVVVKVAGIKPDVLLLGLFCVVLSTTLPRDAVVVSSGSTVVGSGVRRDEYDMSVWSVGVTAWSVDERTRENVEGVAMVTGRPVTDAELEYMSLWNNLTVNQFSIV
jgi:hypothetical protein